MKIALLFEGVAIRTTVEQTYVNETTNPLEITYNVGIGKRMAVSAFEAQVGDEKIIGQIKEAEKALQVNDWKYLFPLVLFLIIF